MHWTPGISRAKEKKRILRQPQKNMQSERVNIIYYRIYSTKELKINVMEVSEIEKVLKLIWREVIHLNKTRNIEP